MDAGFANRTHYMLIVITTGYKRDLQSTGVIRAEP